VEALVVVLILVLWFIPIIASYYVGAEKGRPMQGFYFGALFGVFGLIAIAAMEPAEHIIEKRARALDLTGKQSTTVELETSRCEYCLALIPRIAAACHACGRDVPSLKESSTESSDLMLTIDIDEVIPSHRDSGNLVIVIEPGFVTLSVCDDKCEFAQHELSMSAELADRLFKESIYVYTTHTEEKIYNSQGRVIKIDWVDVSTGSIDDSGTVIIDWTETFSNESRNVKDADESNTSNANHGVLELQGILRDDTSQVNKFEQALAMSIDVAALWGASEITSEQAMTLVDRIGHVRV